LKPKAAPSAVVATEIMPVLKDYERQHRANGLHLLRVFNEYIQSCARRDVAIMREIGMENVGQPPEGTFKAPGVGLDFAEKPNDRSLSVAQDLT
jgi:hypothetical protein